MRGMAPRREILPLNDISFETAAACLSGERGFACIDSRGTKAPCGRYSYVAALPSRTFSMAGGFVTVDGRTAIDSPAEALARFCDVARRESADPYLPFSCGAIGYIGFEGAKALKGFHPAKGFSRHPQCSFGIYRTVLIFDHIEGAAAIAFDGDDSQAAHELIDRLEAAPKWTPKFLNLEMSTDARRLTPDDATFARLLGAAHEWLRSESLSCLHITRREERPIADTSAIEFLLSTRADGARAMFTHESAGIILGSNASAKLQCCDFSNLIGAMPCERLTGTPFSKAIAYIDAHEEFHRRFHGGAFGLVHARGFDFQAIESSAAFADGTIGITAGADLTPDIHPDDFPKLVYRCGSW